MTYSNGMQFTTTDQDNDVHKEMNCASTYKGGWWYKTCHAANLNGLYVVDGDHDTYADGINWKQWHGYSYSLKDVQMKLRPAQVISDINN